ncbi:putative methylcrotonoyl-CoA carboxylase [Helianthus annuus]|nr:putative methylcrotonoyl-CoA carboxylase [Helianthus annuus]
MIAKWLVSCFEARIYAENVSRGFLQPLEFFNITILFQSRQLTGVEEGDTVSMHYDPMIAKLVVWGENRAAALVKLKDSLSKFQVYHIY